MYSESDQYGANVELRSVKLSCTDDSSPRLSYTVREAVLCLSWSEGDDVGANLPISGRLNSAWSYK